MKTAQLAALAAMIWGYDIIRTNAGRMPLGLSAQWDTFKGEWTMQELLDWATNELKLNFVFWGCYERQNTGGLSFTTDVIPAVEKHGTTLITERPSNLNLAER